MTTKKAATRTAMFDISTYPQDVIEENFREAFFDPRGAGELQWAVHRGVCDDSGRITKKGWEVLNEDCMTLERNSMRWMRKNFISASDHGHVDDGLVGTVTFNPRSKTQRDLIELGQSERIDMIDASFGDLSKTVMQGVSEFGRLVLGGGINFRVDED
jgi:hypothetical protein